MALGTAHLRRRRLVHRVLDVSMAVHAREHAAVDRIFELLRRDIKTDWLAGDFLAQGGIAMASQTIVVGGLLRGPRPKRKRNEDQQNTERAAPRFLHRS